MAGPDAPTLRWSGIVRLGLVQTALGAIVVLCTSTLNRVMVVELALPALLPGLLVAFHYGVQMVRPRFGHGADVGGRTTPWIVGGMAVLALGGIGATAATALMAVDRTLGVLAAIVAYAMIGLGVGAAGTSQLTLLAKTVAPHLRAPAATTLWIMMIVGFAVTSAVTGHFLQPFSFGRLVLVHSIAATLAFVVAVLAIRGLEDRARAAHPAGAAATPSGGFRDALAAVWARAEARLFTVFVFVASLAYSMQELILEPFAGIAFGMSPGETTQLSGAQHGGALAGMLLVAVAGGLARRLVGRRFVSLRTWMVGGCLASGAMLALLAAADWFGPAFPLTAVVFALGVGNGAFTIAALGSMMELAGAPKDGREGLRMGLWGAAQAIAFAAGGLLGTGLVDLVRYVYADPLGAYGIVFGIEAGMFVAAAAIAASLGGLHVAAQSNAPPRGARAYAIPRQ